MGQTIIVTGAAGFIGSNIVKALNAEGYKRILAVDNFTAPQKFKNLVDCDVADYLDKREFLECIQNGSFDGEVETIFHLGACSDTLAADGYYVMENNYRYSRILLDWCLDEEVSLIYASSAATYGGNRVFTEDRPNEAPLNIYGYSKFLFDQIVRQKCADAHSQVVGLRYFNVYGPREQHKGRMASVALHHYHQFCQDGRVKLFEGSHGYGNGGQLRDFVYIEDVVKVNLHFLKNPDISGIFNVGSGRAQSFNDVAEATVNGCLQAMNGKGEHYVHQSLDELQKRGFIEYIPFPEDLKNRYQPYTQADLTRLRATGYADETMTVMQGVSAYVRWLTQNCQQN